MQKKKADSGEAVFEYRRTRELCEEREVSMASVLEASGFQRNFFQKVQKGNGNITMSALNRICRKGLNITIPQFYEPNREETTLTADQVYCIERIPKLSGDNYRRLLDYARGLGRISAVGADAKAPSGAKPLSDEKVPS